MSMSDGKQEHEQEQSRVVCEVCGTRRNLGSSMHNNNAFKLIAQLENYDPLCDENGAFYKQLFNELILLFYKKTRNLEHLG